MNETRQVEVRHPYVGEVPAELLVGFEAFKIDAEYQWALVVDGKIVAQMLCCNAHGVLMILRLTSLPEAPHGWGLKMFREAFKECRERGMLGYMAFLADKTRAERRLMTIIMRAGGYLVPFSGVCAAGRLEIGGY